MFMMVDYVREITMKKSFMAGMDCLSICSSSPSLFQLFDFGHTHTH